MCVLLFNIAKAYRVCMNGRWSISGVILLYAEGVFTNFLHVTEEKKNSTITTTTTTTSTNTQNIYRTLRQNTTERAHRMYHDRNKLFYMVYEYTLCFMCSVWWWRYKWIDTRDGKTKKFSVQFSVVYCVTIYFILM